jgi:hypothetical protein
MAILTCSKRWPMMSFIAGAEVRIPLPFEDPKYDDINH